MKWLVAGVVSCAACGDPSLNCAQNRMMVAANSTCEVPPAAIAIDGDLSDWDALLAYPLDCSDCSTGEVGGVYITLTTDDEIAIYAATVGAPLKDQIHRYYIELSPLIGPYYSVGFRVTPTTSEGVIDAVVAVNGYPVRAAFGATGIELAVPRSALPFSAGANAFADLEVRRLGFWERAQNFFAYLATVCWDPDSPLCRPL